MHNSAESAFGQFKSTCFILHAVPLAFRADSKFVRNFVLLLPEQLDIQVVTGESEESA